MSEPEISGSEAARLWLYTEPLWEAGPTSALRKSMQEADERIAAAERECDQLRALLRQVRDTPTYGRALNDIRDLIDASHLLDDEGQQHG